MPSRVIVLNKDHDAVFAEQKKALARAKERKPFLACPAGHVPCLASAEGETVADDVYEVCCEPLHAPVSSFLNHLDHRTNESSHLPSLLARTQCVDVSTSLQSCGGCSLRRSRDGDIEQSDGTDCTLLAHVKSVECQASKCLISARVLVFVQYVYMAYFVA